VEYGEPIVPEKLLFGSSLTTQLDDTYRNGAKGVSFNLTLANVMEGKRQRKAKENFAAELAPKKEKKPRAQSQEVVAKRPKPKKLKQRSRSPSPVHTFLQQGTASRGPLNAPRKTLNDLYPWKALDEPWMERATGRLLREEAPSQEWLAEQKLIKQYSQGYPLFMGAQEQEQLRKMWQVCSSIPGEGSTQEPLYGEINLSGTAKLFAIWKELCSFGSDSVFLDVGSGLAKMVFHAAIDPGVKRSLGIEMSEYRAKTAQSILENLLPKAQIGHIVNRVELLHQDVKAAVSWEGVTHVYMFDLGFPANPFKVSFVIVVVVFFFSRKQNKKTIGTLSAHFEIVGRVFDSPTYDFVSQTDFLVATRISSRACHQVVGKEERGRILFFADALVQKVKQQGNTAGSHCAYFYKKIRDAAPAVVDAVAVASADVQPIGEGSVVESMVIEPEVAADASAAVLSVEAPTFQMTAVEAPPPK
jgi:hypothetical protein